MQKQKKHVCLWHYNTSNGQQNS